MTTVGPVTLVSDVFARCEAMLLQSQVQFVLSHAHPLSSSDLQSQGYRFVCVGSDVLIPVSVPDPQGRARHEPTHATATSPVQMLNYSAESGIGRILRDVRGAALERWPAQSVVKAHLASVLRTMALDGRGMAWLPQTLIAEDLASGRLTEAAPRIGGSRWRFGSTVTGHHSVRPRRTSGQPCVSRRSRPHQRSLGLLLSRQLAAVYQSRRQVTRM